MQAWAYLSGYVDSKLSGIPRCSPSSPALPPIYLVVAAFERGSISNNRRGQLVDGIDFSTIERAGFSFLYPELDGPAYRAERTGGEKCESIMPIIIK